MKLTKHQQALLQLLPDIGNNGKLCKGGKLNTAMSLARLGLARAVGTGWFNGAYFVRTPEGRDAAGAS